MDADDRGVPERFVTLLEALDAHPHWTAVCSQVRIFGTVSEANGRSKCIASSNKCLTSSNKKLVVTSALLVVTRS